MATFTKNKFETFCLKWGLYSIFLILSLKFIGVIGNFLRLMINNLAGLCEGLPHPKLRFIVGDKVTTTNFHINKDNISLDLNKKNEAGFLMILLRFISTNFQICVQICYKCSINNLKCNLFWHFIVHKNDFLWKILVILINIFILHVF